MHVLDSHGDGPRYFGQIMRKAQRLGRITAQPMRSSGSRPCTERSKDRGTSATRSGKRALSHGGGVPAASIAVQVTTAPFWRITSSLSQGDSTVEPSR